MRIVTGTVHRVTVRRAGWGIAIIRTVSSRDKLTIVGRGVGNLTEGETIKASGDDKTHDRYGKQFEVSSIELIDSLIHPGIESAMAFFKGIGPKRAAKLADTYAQGSPDDQRQFLQDLRAMIRPDDVTLNWLTPALLDLANLSVNLGPRGLASMITWLTASYAQYEKSFDEFGNQIRGTRIIGFAANIGKAFDNLKTKMKRDPYEVMTMRYGFREADAILVKRKIIDKHATVRMQYALRELLTNHEDTLFPYQGMVAQVYTEFGIELEPDMSEIGAENTGPAELPGTTKRLNIGNTDMLIDSRLLAAEKAIADNLARLLTTGTVLKDVPDIPHEVLHEGLTITLTAEQVATVVRSTQSPVAIITGGPGTGKTSSVRGLINVLQHLQLGRIMLAAPTNKAARRLSQQTGRPATSVHKLLGAVPDRSPEGDRYGTGFSFATNVVNPLRDTVVILDESSMLDVRLFAAVLDAMGSRCRLILIGDDQQLPPIREGYPLFDLLDRVPTSHLTKILRSDPGQMQLNYTAIRASRLNKVSHKPAPDWEFIECDTDEEILRTVVDVSVPLAKQVGPFGFQIITPRRTGHALSAYEINKRFRERYFSVSDSGFLPGDKGISNTSIAAADMINGDMFLVQKLGETSTGIMTIEKEIRSDPAEQNTLGRFSDGLDFGWAITVHKFQGCETDVVVFVVSPSFGNFLNRNMAYTALTRAKKKVIIIGDKDAFTEALNNEGRRRLTCLSHLSTFSKDDRDALFPATPPSSVDEEE